MDRPEVYGSYKSCWLKYSEHLEARLASQERALGVAKEALIQIDALDPEDPYRFVFMDESAIKSLVMGMGETARRALTQIEGEGVK